MEDGTVAQVVDRLWPTGRESIFVLLDAARDPRIYRLLDRSRLDYRCLFIGKLAPELARSAPYLVHLGSMSKETKTIVSEGFGHNWGVFVRADCLLQELWRHCRNILQVQDENGKQLLFRFYDPRVLRTYLPTCTAKELEIVNGPVSAFFLEDETGKQLLELRVHDGSLETLPHALAPAVAENS